MTLAPKKSLKNEERQRRQMSQISPEYIPANEIEVLEWKEFMNNPKNKANLLNYISCSWENSISFLQDNTSIVLGGTFLDGEKTVELKKEYVIHIQELMCTQHEEADTKIVAHLHYCVNKVDCTRVVVHATDTDIILFCMYNVHQLPNLKELWIEKSNSYLGLHDLVIVLSEHIGTEKQPMMDMLLATYVLTGCDTVSYPFRQGTEKAAKLALKSVGNFSSFASFGKVGASLELKPDVIEEAREFFVSLYGFAGFNHWMN